MTITTNRLLLCVPLLCASSIGALGCQGADVDTVMSEADMRAALPDVAQLTIELPASSARLAPDAVGDPSELRQMTYNLATGANNTVRSVLTMIDNITDHRSVGVDAQTRRWGPWTGEGDEMTQVFIMQLQDDGDLGYSLKWKPAGAEDAELQTVIEGLITGGYNIYKNVGAFNIDYDVAASLNSDVQAQGFAHFEYDSASADRKIHSDMLGVFDAAGQPIDAQMAYVSYADEGGELGFVFQTDMVAQDGVLEDAAIHSRWHYDGAGRSDGTVINGSLPESSRLNLTECWGADALLDFRAYWANGEMQGAEGDPQACTYDDVAFPPLQ